MRIAMPRTDGSEGDNIMSLEWASLGRLVRRRTLEAVAMHFVLHGAEEGTSPGFEESGRVAFMTER